MKRQDRQQRVEEELRRDPSRSDRAIGRAVGADGKTVAAVRHYLESTAEIEEVTTRTGADGRSRYLPTPDAILHHTPARAPAQPVAESNISLPSCPTLATPSDSPPARHYQFTCPKCGGHKIWQSSYRPGPWHCWGCEPPFSDYEVFQEIDYGR